MTQTINASTYREVEAYIYDIPKFTTKNSLKHTEEMLTLLDNPGMNKQIIHVAGTNGKGSVCAFLNELIMKQGFSVGLFSSPHLVSMCERIRINNEMISEKIFCDAFCVVSDKIHDRQKNDAEFPHPTFFEFLFLMAMVVFEQSDVDVILLETGLGGRKDATNVVKPCVSVITEIGLDHCQYLGDTKEKIAWEKAGIIKDNTPVVYIDKEKNVSKIIEQVAQRKGAETYPVTREEYHVEKSNHKNVDFSFYSRYYNYVSFTLSTSALYQAENASVALRAFEVFMGDKEYQLSDLQSALASMKWEGRMDEVLPGIYLDGAHNTDGVCAFLDTVRAHEHTGRNILLFAVVDDKSYQKMTRMIMESCLFDEIIITGMEDKRAVSPDELKQIFAQYTVEKLHTFMHVSEALSYAMQIKSDKDMLYIAGSLYLVGYVLPLLKEDSHD